MIVAGPLRSDGLPHLDLRPRGADALLRQLRLPEREAGLCHRWGKGPSAGGQNGRCSLPCVSNICRRGVWCWHWWPLWKPGGLDLPEEAQNAPNFCPPSDKFVMTLPWCAQAWSEVAERDGGSSSSQSSQCCELAVVSLQTSRDQRCTSRDIMGRARSMVCNLFTIVHHQTSGRIAPRGSCK